MKTKYDTLKKEYDELRIRHDNAYAKKILAEAKRDKCIEALKAAVDYLRINKSNHICSGSILHTIFKQTLKNNSK